MKRMTHPLLGVALAGVLLAGPSWAAPATPSGPPKPTTPVATPIAAPKSAPAQKPGAATATPATAPRITVNGKVLSEPPRMVAGKVMIPLRTLFEAVGAQVDFKNGVIQASRDNHLVVMKLGDANAKVDGKVVKMEAPAVAVDGVTVVPLRFLANTFGARISWDPASQTLDIQPPAMPVQALGDFEPKTDLKRLAIGNQASILKVFDDRRQQVVFFKGLDDRQQAKLSPEDRLAIRTAMGIPEGKAHEAVKMLLDSYGQLPKRETIALLGALASTPELSGDPGVHARIEAFLVERMMSDKDVAVRRQATLALALCDTVTPATVDKVCEFYAKTDNLWVTFPVQQFFEYHADIIKTMPAYQSIVQQLGGVNSLYTPNILKYLQ